MIDLPDGKVLVAVDTGIKCKGECTYEDFSCPIDCCVGCDLRGDSPDIEKIQGMGDDETCGYFCCTSQTRRDSRNVIFKLVDYPGENKNP